MMVRELTKKIVKNNNQCKVQLSIYPGLQILITGKFNHSSSYSNELFYILINL